MKCLRFCEKGFESGWKLTGFERVDARLCARFVLLSVLACGLHRGPPEVSPRKKDSSWIREVMDFRYFKSNHLWRMDEISAARRSAAIGEGVVDIYNILHQYWRHWRNQNVGGNGYFAGGSHAYRRAAKCRGGDVSTLDMDGNCCTWKRLFYV